MKKILTCTEIAALCFRFTLFGRLPFLRGLLRNLLSFAPRLGKTDGDRLLAALDLSTRATALKGPGLALLHRAPDLGGCLFRILPCHDASPGCAKTIFAAEVGSRFASFPRLAFGFPDVRRSPHKARTHSLRYAIERDSPA